jgi:hypothetical protein
MQNDLFAKITNRNSAKNQESTIFCLDSFEKVKGNVWDLFKGFDTLRAITFSVSIEAVLKLIKLTNLKEVQLLIGLESHYHSINSLLKLREETRRLIDFANKVKNFEIFYSPSRGGRSGLCAAGQPGRRDRQHQRRREEREQQ